MYAINGVGIKLYGKRDKQIDGSFIATRWFVVLWLPVIPLGSYRVIKGSTNEIGIPLVTVGWSTQYQMQKVAINWEQIIATYIVVYGSIGILIFDFVYDPKFIVCKGAFVVGLPYLLYRIFGNKWWSFVLAGITVIILLQYVITM